MVVFSTEALDCHVKIELAGFAFDENGDHSESLIPYEADITNSNTAGCNKPGTTAATGTDVQDTLGAIGCGRYKVTISDNDSNFDPLIFYLDLTDGHWRDNTDSSGRHSYLFKIQAPGG